MHDTVVAAGVLVLAGLPGMALGGHGHFVVPPGQEAFFLEVAKPGKDFPGGAKLDGVQISRDKVVLEYTVGGRKTSIALLHPHQGQGHPGVMAGDFLVVPSEGVPAALRAAVVSRLRAHTFRWKLATQGNRPLSATKGPASRYWTPAFDPQAVRLAYIGLPNYLLWKEAADWLRQARHSVMAKKKDCQKALNLAKRIAALGDPQSVLAAAHVYRLCSMPEKAVELLGGLAKTAPRITRQIVVEFAATLELAGKHEEGVRMLHNLEDPRCAYTDVLTLLYTEGHEDTVRRAAMALSEKDDGSMKPCEALFLLKLAIATGDDSQVDEAAVRLLHIDPNNKHGMFMWGIYYYERMQFDKAIKAWRRLVYTDPRYPAVLAQYVTAHLVSGLLDDKGIARFRKLADADANDIVDAYLVGVGYFYKGHRTRKKENCAAAIPYLERVGRAVKHYSRSRLYIAMANFFTGKQDLARKMLDELEPYAYYDPDIYYCKSLVWRSKDLKRAITEMERFLKVFVGEHRTSLGDAKVRKARLAWKG